MYKKPELIAGLELFQIATKTPNGFSLEQSPLLKSPTTTYYALKKFQMW